MIGKKKEKKTLTPKTSSPSTLGMIYYTIVLYTISTIQGIGQDRTGRSVYTSMM